MFFAIYSTFAAFFLCFMEPLCFAVMLPTPSLGSFYFTSQPQAKKSTSLARKFVGAHEKSTQWIAFTNCSHCRTHIHLRKVWSREHGRWLCIVVATEFALETDTTGEMRFLLVFTVWWWRVNVLLVFSLIFIRPGHVCSFQFYFYMFMLNSQLSFPNNHSISKRAVTQMITRQSIFLLGKRLGENQFPANVSNSLQRRGS